MKDIILIGGGGHCEAVIDVIEQEGQFKIIGVIDKLELQGKTILGYEIIGSDSDLGRLSRNCKNALITIGQIKSPAPRIKIYNKLLELGFNLPTIVSPRAYVSKHSKIGSGSVIMHDAFIGANSNVGRNCIINTKSIIEHGSNIDDHCHISTNAVINGGVIVGSGTFIGSGSVTKEGISIIDNYFAKAGSIIK
jgi:sugar O-acyltransferase (sialic acid O-acetyltransferase NeuD family)